MVNRDVLCTDISLARGFGVQDSGFGKELRTEPRPPNPEPKRLIEAGNVR